MSIKSLLQQNTQILAITSPTPRLDVELLLAYVLQQERSYLYAHYDQEIAANDLTLLNNLIKQRIEGKPIAYLIKQKEFWSLNLNINENVLIPRPETELLVELTLQFLTSNDATIADLGTGSGAIALALAKERPNWHIVATDKSAEALLVAKNNALHFKLNNLEFNLGEWCEALPNYKFDAILSNPPYIAENDPNLKSSIRYEPTLALIAKNNGLDALNSIIIQAKDKLKPNGMLILEHGYTQGTAVQKLLAQNGYLNIKQYRDLAGLDRAVCAFLR
jgi:release factor glutamine methyltransferase